MKSHLIARVTRLEISSYKPNLKVLGENLTPKPPLVIFAWTEVVKQNVLKRTVRLYCTTALVLLNL